MISRLATAGITTVLLAICSGCKKSDESIISTFHANKAALNRIAELAREDYAAGHLHQFIFRTSARSDHSQIADAHWLEYQRLLSQIDAEGVAASDNDVEVRIQYIGEFQKGLMLKLSPPSPTFASLDSFYPSEQTRTSNHGDYIAYRRVEGNWYLYAFYY